MISLVMPYYLNPEMLARQYRNFTSWPSRARAAIKVIIVDDGSPRDPAANVPRPYGLPELEIYRVLEDRPWHQHAARNLGAHVADSEWLLLTDMDHMLEAGGAMALHRLAAHGRLDHRFAYMLDRIEADTRELTRAPNGQPKPHPNSFVMSRELYWRIGGYDERATGIYGTDALFRKRAFDIGRKGHLEIPLVRFWRDVVPDASTTTLPRKEGRDNAARARILDEIGRNPGGKLVLNFEWERVF
jgi:hypothetical protein